LALSAAGDRPDLSDAVVVKSVRPTLAEHPLAEAELEIALGLDGPGRAALTEVDRWPGPVHEFGSVPDVVDRLAAIDEYALFARDTLERAAERVAAIHAGEVPYVADKAFSTTEADVLWRAAVVALLRDEPWLADLLAALLPGVAVAPTAAKTMPSQSACTVLAQAVEAYPTPEGIAAMRQARAVIRHAGVTKKLDRLLRTAERSLARRPGLALRLPAGTATTRAQLTTLTRALEAGYPLETTHRYDRWRADFATHPHAGAIARRLIWQFTDGDGWRAVLPSGEPFSLADAAGHPVAEPPAATPVRLWHPAGVDDGQRAAWRERVVALRLVQPFRQAFREYYPSPAGDDAARTPDFTGHVVAVRPLLGLAVREGWTISDPDGVLRRDFAGWRVEVEVSARLYPGADGFGDVGAARLYRREGTLWHRTPFALAPPVLVSEAMRGIDLLVSVAAFGLQDDPRMHLDHDRWQRLRTLAERPLGEQARTRRDALRLVLTDVPGVTFGTRHVHVGPYAVHLVTARVTRDGAPIPVDLPTAAPAAPPLWLPYDERLLERIARTVLQLAVP
jgi:hypothetical protein